MSGSKKRKPYTHLACQACKDKHLKCDGLKPTCGNCISKRSECHYREERNRRRDSSQPHLQKMEEDLREHIFNLERQVDLWKQKYLALKDIARAANVPVALDPPGRGMNEEIPGRRELQRLTHPDMQDVYLARRPRLMPQEAMYGGVPSDGDLQYGDPRMAEEVLPIEAAMHRGIFMYEEFPPGMMPPPPPHEYAHLPGMNEHPFFHNRPQQVQFPLYVPHKSNTPGLVSLHGAFSAPDLEVRQVSAGNVPNFDVHHFSFEEMKPFPASGSSPAVFGNRHYSEPKPLEAPSSFDPRLFSSLVDSKPAEMYNPDPESGARYTDPPRSPRYTDPSTNRYPNSDGGRYPGTNVRYSDQSIEGHYTETPSPGPRVYGTQPPEPGDAQYPPDPGTDSQFAEPGTHTQFPEPGASPQYGESSQFTNPTPFSHESGMEGTQSYQMIGGRASQNSTNGGTKD